MLVCIARKPDGKRHQDLTESCGYPSPERWAIEMKWKCCLLAVQRKCGTPTITGRCPTERTELYT